MGAGYVPAATALDPLGAAFGQGLGSGIMQGIQDRMFRNDYDAFTDYLTRMAQASSIPGSAVNDATSLASQAAAMSMGGFAGPIQAVPNNLGSMVAPPELRTPQMQQAMLQFRLGQLMNPMQQAQIENERAQAELYRAQANSKSADYQKTDPRFYLSQGYSEDDANKAARIAANLESGPQAPKTYEPVMLFNPKTGNQTQWTPGDPIPEGGPWQKVGSGPSTVVNVGGDGKITQPTRTTLEKQVIDDSNFATSIGDLAEGFNSKYFEIGPNISSWIYNNLTGKVQSIRDAVPAKDQEFYAEMEAYKSSANQVFNEYRKVITGAQAGMPEIQFLRKSVPTTSDSPEVFRAKARVAQEFFRRRAELYQDALASDNPMRALTQSRQLDQQVAKEIGEQVKQGAFGDELKQSLGVATPPTAQMTQGQQIALLRQRGVPIEQIREALAYEEQLKANPNAKPIDDQMVLRNTSLAEQTQQAPVEVDIGQIVEQDGKRYKITGFNPDGTAIGEEVQ